MALTWAPRIDAELAVLQYLRTVPELTSVLPPDRICTEIPADGRGAFLLVTRVLGEYLAPGVDAAILQVDAVAPAKKTANEIAAVASAALCGIANSIVAEGVLAAGFEELGPAWLPDTISVPPIPRYTARYRVVTHR